MLMSELRNLISEKIVKRIGAKQKFSLSEFEGLESLEDMLSYAKAHLRELYKGTGRYTFILTSKKVLKIALNKDGIKQNKFEVDFLERVPSSAKDIFTNVYQSDADHKWIIADLVNPLFDDEKGYETFSRTAGFDFDNLGPSIRSDKNTNSELVQKLRAVKSLIDTSELTLLFNWGLTADGRLVVLDYGR